MPMKCGLQLQSVREFLRFDPAGTLERVAEIGYRHIELTNHNVDNPGSWYGLDADRLRTLAERVGLNVIGGYVKGFHTKNADAIIKFYADVGGERITIPIDYFPDQTVLNEKCSQYNRLGESCRKNGLQLSYENHYHEFQRINGGQVIDLLLSGTRPENLSLSLNNYWLMRGLVEPIETLRRYAPRIGSLVLQDYPLDQIDKFNVWTFSRFHPISRNINRDVPLKGGEIENINPVHCELFTEIGNGIFNLQSLIDEADMIGSVRYVLLKQDYTRMSSEFDSIKVSMSNCKKLRGLSWD